MKTVYKNFIFAMFAIFCICGASQTHVHAAGPATGAQVIQNAFSMQNYVYWYGGSGEKCTYELLDRFARLYPSVYTDTYKSKCKQDVLNGKYCIDCSGFVCKASGLPHYSTYAMATSNAFYEGNKEVPKNGAIVWNWTHCGLYYDGRVIEGLAFGKVIEARGVDSDICTDRIYNSANWQRVYYVAGINYDALEAPAVKQAHTAAEYCIIAAEVISGKLGNGAARIANVHKMGYDYDRVQKIVNVAVRGY